MLVVVVVKVDVEVLEEHVGQVAVAEKAEEEVHVVGQEVQHNDIELILCNVVHILVLLDVQ